MTKNLLTEAVINVLKKLNEPYYQKYGNDKLISTDEKRWREILRKQYGRKTIMYSIG